MKKKVALIDSDSIIFILAWHHRESRVEADMELAVDQFMVDLVTATEATHYLGVFSPSDTFRTRLYPAYKANRRGGSPSEHIAFWKPRIIEQCMSQYQFIKADDIEADDVLSIMRSDDAIYCSPDKDLKQIPGIHYDYSKGKWETITEEEAAYRFWMQMLTGDSTDNIPGCKGIGLVNAAKVLAPHREGGRHAIASAVRQTYLGNLKYASLEEAKEQFILMAQLLQMVQPTPELVAEFSRHIIPVAYKEVVIDPSEVVARFEAELNIETHGVLQNDQRPHADDLLRSAADIPEQV